MTDQHSSSPQPQNKEQAASWLSNTFYNALGLKEKFACSPLFFFWSGLVITCISGVVIGVGFFISAYIAIQAFIVGLGLIFFALGTYFLLKAFGIALTKSAKRLSGRNPVELSYRLLQNEINLDASRRGILAPELALIQFAQQVRAYATERAFQASKQERGELSKSAGPIDTSDLLKRRWNDVLDTLNELEIYLANDPAGVIEKLVSRHTSQQVTDVSQIFREVCESFDVTWRRKGVNIESAIVTPLRANISDVLLRRILVGPWRACVYLARRGNGVVFSAKSENGQVIAKWLCDGLVMPEEFLALAQDSTKSVNHRIELGLEYLNGDSKNNTIFHGLVSFIIWIDLAKQAKIHYEFKQTNDGFMICLYL